MRMAFSAVLAVTFAMGTPSFGDEIGDESSNTRSPHQELREAVWKIRSHYAPDGYLSVAHDLAELSRRPRLGLILQSSSTATSEGSVRGAVVLAVSPGSPADEAGLQPGDVITGWNGQTLGDGADDSDGAGLAASQDLVERSRALEDGESVTLQYLRDGEEYDVTLVAREVGFSQQFVEEWVEPFTVRPQKAWPLMLSPSGSWSIFSNWSDMELVALNPELGAYFGTDVGVLVVRGPTDDESLGLESGDVILRIGDREVKSPEHAMRILRSYEPEEDLTIDIVRHRESQTLNGTIPQAPRAFLYRDDLGRRGD